MRRAFMLATMAAAGLAVGGCGGAIQATRDISMTKPWHDFTHLAVHSRNGSVDVSVAEGSEVRITGKTYVRGLTLAEANARLDEIHVVVAADPGDPQTLLIKLEVPESLNNASPGADLRVSVPHACPAEVATSNGGIRAVGLKDSVVLDASNGDIAAENVAGQVQARTSNGHVVARNIKGDLAAETSNGGVVAENVTGHCQLRTSNAGLEVGGVCGPVDAETSNGRIHVDAIPPDDASIVLRTSNGSIDARLPRTMTAEVNLETSNGAVDFQPADIPLKVQHISKHNVRAALNGGGSGRIAAETSNGSITLSFR